MKRINLLPAALFLSASAFAAINASDATKIFSPLTEGYLQRARTMADAGNYAGVIDQLRHLDTQHISLTDNETEEYTFLLAKAYYERGDQECLRLLRDFIREYPASAHATAAALNIADFEFFRHNWPDALEAYNAVDFDRLNADQRTLYSYRKALSMINTGHFVEARPLIARLRDKNGYEDAYHFYKAYLDYIDGNFNAAYEGFRRVNPSAEGLAPGYYMTQIEYTRGEYDNVISHGRSILSRRPLPELAPEINRIVGLSYFKKGESAVAQGFLENYMDHTDGTPDLDAVYALGVAAYENEEYPQALKYFSDLTDDSGPLGQSAWLYIGQCYLHQDNPTSAAMAFERATRIEADPAVSETALYNYVTSLTRGGKIPFSSSADLLENFVKRFPDSEYTPEVEGYLATAYYNDRNYSRALQCIDAVRHPSDKLLAAKQKILYELGIEAATNSHTDQAVKYLRQSYELRSHDRALGAQTALWLGDALYTLGNYREARKYYEAFLKDKSTHENVALAYYNLAYAKYKADDFSGAARDFADAIRLRNGLDARQIEDATIRRADCLYYTGKYEEALKLYADAIGQDATDSDYALYRSAQIKGRRGDISAKLAEFRTLESRYPNSTWLSKALLESAQIYEDQGRADLAADAYKKRLAIAADVDVDELLRMARAMNDAHRSQDLLDVTDKIRHAGGLEADEIAEISLYEADAYAKLGRDNEAEDIYRSLAQNPTSLPGATAAVTLAETKLLKGDAEAARSIMEEFTETGTPHQYWLARGFITLADAYSALGQDYLAKEYLLSLRDNYPSDSDDIKSRISSRLKKIR